MIHMCDWLNLEASKMYLKIMVFPHWIVWFIRERQIINIALLWFLMYKYNFAVHYANKHYTTSWEQVSETLYM